MDKLKSRDFLDKYSKDLTDYFNRMASEIKGNIPDFYLTDSNSDSFYNLETRAIHVGFRLLLDGVEKDDKVKTGVEALIGHEIQHGLSTTEAGWFNVINNGPKEFIKYIADKKNILIKLGEDGYIDALKDAYEIDSLQANRKIECFKNLCSRIVNSIEDGRIERIRSYNYPGFRKKILFFNFFAWDMGSISNYILNNPKLLHTKQGVLEIVLQNLLSLSVARYYSKDYELINGDLRKECDSYLEKIIPFIKKAIKAPSCRQMSIECLNICKELAPLIMEVLDEIFDNQNELPNFNGQVGCKSKQNESSDENNNSEENSSGNESKNSNDTSLATQDLEELLQELNNNSNLGQLFASGREEKTGEDVPEDFDISKDSELFTGMVNNNQDRSEGIKQKIKRETKTRRRPEQVKIDVIGNETALPDILPLIDTYGDFEEVKRPYNLNNKLPANLLVSGEDLKRRIKEALTIKTNTSRHRKSGRIRSLDIFRLGFNDTDIFNNKETNPADVVCYILADNSGSMGDGDTPEDNRYHELRSLAVIEHAFSDFIPLKISSFNTYGGTIHRKLKDFDEKVFNNSSYNFLVECGCEGANDDAYSVAVATKELLARTEANKLLLVLSDGLPCSNEDKLTEEVVNARNMGIKVIPIYFGSKHDTEDFKRLYLQDYIITEPENINEELEQTLLSHCFN